MSVDVKVGSVESTVVPNVLCGCDAWPLIVRLKKSTYIGN